MANGATHYADAGVEVEGWETPAHATAARASSRVSTSEPAEATPATPDRRCRCTSVSNCQQWVLTWSAAVLVGAVAAYGFMWLRGGSLTYASLVGNLHAATTARIDSQVLHVAMDDVRAWISRGVALWRKPALARTLGEAQDLLTPPIWALVPVLAALRMAPDMLPGFRPRALNAQDAAPLPQH